MGCRKKVAANSLTRFVTKHTVHTHEAQAPEPPVVPITNESVMEITHRCVKAPSFRRRPGEQSVRCSS